MTWLKKLLSGRNQRIAKISRCQGRRTGMHMERLESRLVFNVAYGDFNNDGQQDMAVGVPGEDITYLTVEQYDAGAVNVIYGEALIALNQGDFDEQFWHQDNGTSVPDGTTVQGEAQTGDRFGSALAVGDFNGDGFDDLAIGVPGEDINGKEDAGAVHIIFGSEKLLTSEGSQFIHQDTFGLLDEADEYDRFGSVLSVGDFNGDGVDDLAIGVPNENLDPTDAFGDEIPDAGIVQILYGAHGVGLTTVGNQLFHQDLIGPNAPEQLDQFGAALASADFNGDGTDDLAIGVPAEDVNVNGTELPDAGAVHLVFGVEAQGLSAAGNRYYTQGQSNVPDQSEAFDNFGASLAAGKFDDDDFFDLAIGVPNEDWGGGWVDTGAVHTMYGRAGQAGFDPAKHQFWDQHQAQVDGDHEAEDWFGASLAVGDFDGNGYDDLAIGTPGKDFDWTSPITVGNAGLVYVLFASDLGTGISPVDQRKFHQFMPAMDDDDGSENQYDYFGANLAAGDMDGDGAADLAVSVPGEENHGAIHFIPGDKGTHFFQLAWDQVWSQDTLGVSDESELGDLFGGQLSAWAGQQQIESFVYPVDALRLHSNPGASRVLYLNFSGGWSPHDSLGPFGIGDGDEEYTPPFDLDGQFGWSPTELAVIENVWAQVAEDYAPFDVDVTTEHPYPLDSPDSPWQITLPESLESSIETLTYLLGSISNVVDTEDIYRVMIGGDSTERLASFAPGISFGPVYLNSMENSVFVFANNPFFTNNLTNDALSPIVAQIANAASHESGHGFGLAHQCEVDEEGNPRDLDADGTVELGDDGNGGDAYSPGGIGWAPIMGAGPESDRTIWTDEGEVIGPGRILSAVTNFIWLPDIGIWSDEGNALSSISSTLGWRADDHNEGDFGATSLNELVTKRVATGILSAHDELDANQDIDRFSFTLSEASWVVIDLDVADVGPNLDSTLTLRQSEKNFLESDAPANGLGARIERFLEAGTYFVEVGSEGRFSGDVGQYTLRISKPEIDLIVNGTSDDDTIIVRSNSTDPGVLEIDVNGNVATYRAAELRSITIKGFEGDDRVSILDLPEHINMVINGNEDNDTFEIGGSEIDSISGDVSNKVLGPITLNGGSGNNQLSVLDENSFGSDFEYMITGATVEVPEKGVWVQYQRIASVTLQANSNGNDISVFDIPLGMTVDVHGNGGNDTLTLGASAGEEGNLSTIRGDVHFVGGSGTMDQLILNDLAATSGRTFLFDESSNLGIVTARNAGRFGFGDDVEHVQLDASDYQDQVNVEALFKNTTLELFGNGETDVFYVAPSAQNLDAIQGDITIHGGSGFGDAVNQDEYEKKVDDDQVYVYDDLNSDPDTGDFSIELLDPGLEATGRITRFEATSIPGDDVGGPSDFQLTYDQIEQTYLSTDDDANNIQVKGAPKFNQITVHAGDGTDDISVHSTASEASMYVAGEGGTDTIRISPFARNLDNLFQTLEVDGGANAGDQLNVYDDDFTGAEPYSLNALSLWRTNALAATERRIRYAGFDRMDVYLNNEDNTINILSTAEGTNINIFGSGGNDNLIVTSANSPVVFSGGSDVDYATWIGSDSDDTFTVRENTLSREEASLTTGSDVEGRSIEGGGGTDLLQIEGVAGVDELFYIKPDTSQPYQGLVELGNWQPLTYEVEDFFVEGNEQDLDRLRVDGTPTEEDFFNINLGAHGTHNSPLVTASTAEGEFLRLQSATGLSSSGTVSTPAIGIHALSQLGEFDVIAPELAPEGNPTDISLYGSDGWATLDVTYNVGGEVPPYFLLDSVPSVISVEYADRSYKITVSKIDEVTKVQTIPGDFDGDGTVGDGDYKLWEEYFGQDVEPYTNGDANGDGKVDLADYTLWKDHYGETQKPAGAVAASFAIEEEEAPEESSVLSLENATYDSAIVQTVSEWSFDSHAVHGRPAKRTSFMNRVATNHRQESLLSRSSRCRPAPRPRQPESLSEETLVSQRLTAKDAWFAALGGRG